MTFGEHQIGVLRQGAEAREIGQMAGHRGFEQGAVAPPRDPVEDHSGERQLGVVPGKPGDQCRGRGALVAGVDDEHDRPPGELRERGGRASLAVQPGPVEEAHHPLAQDEVGGRFERADEPGKRCRAHRPDVEVEADAAARRGMEGRVDIVGPGLRRGDADPALAQMAQQPRRHQRLAAARFRGGKDQPAPAHRSPFLDIITRRPSLRPAGAPHSHRDFDGA